MASSKGKMCFGALALLAFVCHAATRSNAEDARTTTQAVTTNAINANGDGTVDFSDLIAFTSQFGKAVSRRPTLKKRRTAGSLNKVESLGRDTVRTSNPEWDKVSGNRHHQT